MQGRRVSKAATSLLILFFYLVYFMSIYVLFQNLKERPPSNSLRFSPLIKRAYTWTYDKISYVFYTKMLTIGN